MINEGQVVLDDQVALCLLLAAQPGLDGNAREKSSGWSLSETTSYGSDCGSTGITSEGRTARKSRLRTENAKSVVDH